MGPRRQGLTGGVGGEARPAGGGLLRRQLEGGGGGAEAEEQQQGGGAQHLLSEVEQVEEGGVQGFGVCSSRRPFL